MKEKGEELPLPLSLFPFDFRRKREEKSKKTNEKQNKAFRGADRKREERSKKKNKALMRKSNFGSCLRKVETS